jgi:DNA-binding transcriptional MerR regulator
MYELDEDEIEDIKSQANLTRTSCILSAVRGDSFYQNLFKACESEICKKMVEQFRLRKSIELDKSVSYRVLSHWEDLNLLECERSNETGWRKFNLIEVLWLRIIQSLRNMGLPLSKIAQIKSIYFEQISDRCPLNYNDYYLIAAIAFKEPVFFIVLPEENQAEFLTYFEFQRALKGKLLGDYICLNLNNLLNTVLVKNVSFSFPSQREVSPELNKLCDLLEEDFDEATIQKKGKAFQKIEMEKHFESGIPDCDILEGHEDADIIKKKRKGVIVKKQRKIIKKLNQ